MLLQVTVQWISLLLLDALDVHVRGFSKNSINAIIT